MRPKAARTDILAANEPQPVDPLLVGQADGLFAFAHFAPGRTSPVEAATIPQIRLHKVGRG